MHAAGTFQDRLAPLADRLFGYALALTRDRDLALDLFQDCIVRALSAPDLPECEAAFRSWLFSIMRNRWIDAARSDRRQRCQLRRISDDAPDWIRPEAPPDLGAVVVNQLAVRQAFEALSAGHRDVLALVDIAGFGYEEAAAVLGVPKGTVMSRVSRARKDLCRRLSATAVVPIRRAARSQR